MKGLIFEAHFLKCRAGFYMAHQICRPINDSNSEDVVLYKRFIMIYNMIIGILLRLKHDVKKIKDG